MEGIDKKVAAMSAGIMTVMDIVQNDFLEYASKTIQTIDKAIKESTEVFPELNEQDKKEVYDHTNAHILPLMLVHLEHAVKSQMFSSAKSFGTPVEEILPQMDKFITDSRVMLLMSLSDPDLDKKYPPEIMTKVTDFLSTTLEPTDEAEIVASLEEIVPKALAEDQ